MRSPLALALTFAALATSGCAQCGSRGRQVDAGDIVQLPLMLAQAPLIGGLAELHCLDSSAPAVCREEVWETLLTPTRWLSRGVCEVVRLPITLGDAWWEGRNDEDEPAEPDATEPPPTEARATPSVRSLRRAQSPRIGLAEGRRNRPGRVSATQRERPGHL